MEEEEEEYVGKVNGKPTTVKGKASGHEGSRRNMKPGLQ